MAGPKGKMVVCKVEYETKDRVNWKAVILAYNMKAAVDYLMKNVPGWDKYISTQIVGDVDAIENELYEDYFVQGDTGVKEKVTNIVYGDVQPKCPWCDKEFKSKNTLGNHIKKYHMD